MQNKCLNCGKPVKNKYCNVSCQNIHQWTGKKHSKESIDKFKATKQSKWKHFTVKCYKCCNSFDIKEYDVNKPKKEKYFCSRSCANSRTHSDKTKLKISITAKNSEKVKLANKINAKQKRSKIIIVVSNCLYCNGEIMHKQYKPRKYHKECWLKCSGGLQQGSSRGKCGWYKGYWCDSSYELAWIIYQLDHNINFKRNLDGFEYIFNDKKHKYYPDFILENDSYVEIKNYKSELTNAKLAYFPHKIEVLYKDEMNKEILPYVITNYGKDFIKLYENKLWNVKNVKVK